MMANLRRSKNKKPDVQCKKHPKHKQSPGVCSICLVEKLSLLYTSSRSSSLLNATMDMASSASSSSSLSSYYSSSSASSCSSPAPGDERRTVAPMSFLFSGISKKNTGLTKSRSMAFGARKVNNGGFWGKLLGVHHRTNKSGSHGEGLVQSRTLKEMVMTA